MFTRFPLRPCRQSRRARACGSASAPSAPTPSRSRCVRSCMRVRVVVCGGGCACFVLCVRSCLPYTDHVVNDVFLSTSRCGRPVRRPTGWRSGRANGRPLNRCACRSTSTSRTTADFSTTRPCTPTSSASTRSWVPSAFPSKRCDATERAPPHARTHTAHH